LSLCFIYVTVVVAVVQNPFQSILAQYMSNGSKSVYETTFKIMDYPDLGTWKINLVNNVSLVESYLSFMHNGGGTAERSESS
jgi:hypothetical protein